ncbi:hypothetical protein B0H10DRAFT_2436926 [Mycena sp. CBHHK59/15]|nr:hypothetical protein B0H10DRAFT_2436926 [Mycena sp. CBHHK59/15]
MPPTRARKVSCTVLFPATPLSGAARFRFAVRARVDAVLWMLLTFSPALGRVCQQGVVTRPAARPAARRRPAVGDGPQPSRPPRTASCVATSIPPSPRPRPPRARAPPQAHSVLPFPFPVLSQSPPASLPSSFDPYFHLRTRPCPPRPMPTHSATPCCVTPSRPSSRPSSPHPSHPFAMRSSFVSSYPSLAPTPLRPSTPTGIRTLRPRIVTSQQTLPCPSISHAPPLVLCVLAVPGAARTRPSFGGAKAAPKLDEAADSTLPRVEEAGGVDVYAALTSVEEDCTLPAESVADTGGADTPSELDQEADGQLPAESVELRGERYGGGIR